MEPGNYFVTHEQKSILSEEASEIEYKNKLTHLEELASEQQEMSKLTRYHKFIEKGNYFFLDELPQLVAQAIVRSKVSPQNYTEDDLKIRDVFYYPERCDSVGRLESNRSIKNEKFDFKIHLKVKKRIREKK